MGIAHRRERDREAIRERIFEAARELFVAEGYDAVTMRRIAHKIEHAPSIIYQHFADKDTLIRELCNHDFAAFAAQFDRLDRIRDPLERLRRSGHAYVEFAVRYHNAYRLLFMRPHAAPNAGGAAAAKAYEFIAVTAADAVAKGALAPEWHDYELVAQTCWAGVHGVASLHIAMGPDSSLPWRPLAKRAKAMIDTLVRGLQKEPS
jgi:AcrR family transcriptional regulator